MVNLQLFTYFLKKMCIVSIVVLMGSDAAVAQHKEYVVVFKSFWSGGSTALLHYNFLHPDRHIVDTTNINNDSMMNYKQLHKLISKARKRRFVQHKMVIDLAFMCVGEGVEYYVAKCGSTKRKNYVTVYCLSNMTKYILVGEEYSSFHDWYEIIQKIRKDEEDM